MSEQKNQKDSNLSITLDLSKLGEVKEGKVVISLDNAFIVLGKRGDGAYLGLTAYEANAKNQKGNQTHVIKPAIPKDAYLRMSEEAKKNVPIVGGLVDWKKANNK